MAKKRPPKKETKAKEPKPSRRAIEQYAHDDKDRLNNPPVGLVTPATDPPETKRKTYAYDPHLDPQLVWAGKAERTSFEVPTVSLHVHERIDPKTIIRVVRSNGNGNGAGKKRPRQQSLFEEPDENPPLRDALDFYKHKHGWTNRLIAGDSLLVMNSLLEKEGMAGKVQMIYIDPPYGIRYGSNFQPFVNRRDVADGKDEDLSQEPEVVHAFRDTWARLAKTLKAEIDEEKIEAYRGTVSLPFEPGEHNRVAVKIVDDRGIESLKLLDIPEPGG